MLFLNDVDAIASKRVVGWGGSGSSGDRLLSQLLTELDEILW